MKLSTALFVFCFFCSSALGLSSESEDGPLLEGRKVAETFMQELKGELEQAIAAAGPVSAIGVCQSKAPAIAARLSVETGWQVGRTSLRVRNPDNAPDRWEKAILKDFDRRRFQGAAPQNLEVLEIVERDGGKVLRYMKAIPTGEICLLCHGAVLAPGVADELTRRYPQDKARGYNPGEIRGAFTLSRPVEGEGSE
jgi:hypothetical protein